MTDGCPQTELPPLIITPPGQTDVSFQVQMCRWKRSLPQDLFAPSLPDVPRPTVPIANRKAVKITS